MLQGRRSGERARVPTRAKECRQVPSAPVRSARAWPSCRGHPSATGPVPPAGHVHRHRTVEPHRRQRRTVQRRLAFERLGLQFTSRLRAGLPFRYPVQFRPQLGAPARRAELAALHDHGRLGPTPAAPHVVALTSRPTDSTSSRISPTGEEQASWCRGHRQAVNSTLRWEPGCVDRCATSCTSMPVRSPTGPQAPGRPRRGPTQPPSRSMACRRTSARRGASARRFGDTGGSRDVRDSAEVAFSAVARFRGPPRFTGPPARQVGAWRRCPAGRRRDRPPPTRSRPRGP